MPVSGEGRRRILVVAEAPGKDEDDQGIQLVGKSGTLLKDKLRQLGVDMRRDCWLTNAVICRPPNNETPDNNKIDYCRPNLIKTLNELKPEIIIPIGKSAVRSLIGHVWKDSDLGEMSRWAGWNIPCQKPNAWICPTYHPAYLLRMNDPLLDKLFSEHLEAAIEHEGRPWKEIPDYKAQVECVQDVNKAARIIREFIQRGGVSAFDYETTSIKPEHEQADILAASICWRGKRTIAFPMYGEARQAMREFLESDVPKIGANMKFEDRWSRRVLGVHVRKWYWDTVLGAHTEDQREGTTSVKFQAFVRLGVMSYDDHIKPLLKAKKGTKVNQARREIDLSDLLLYNGLDSLLEYLIAMEQMRSLKYPLPQGAGK